MHFGLDPLLTLAKSRFDLLILAAAVREADEIRRQNEEELAKGG